jgi:hypothetical protein
MFNPILQALVLYLLVWKRHGKSKESALRLCVLGSVVLDPLSVRPR